MENSINFYHNENFIKTSRDDILFVKNNNKWVEVNNSLYKSEKNIPENDFGNEGDYFITYKRRYNYFNYSEEFTPSTSNNCWTSFGCSFLNNNLYKFPNTYAKKIKGLTSNSEHYIQYQIVNTYTPITFSLYVKPEIGEIYEVSLSLNDESFQNNIEMKINFATDENEVIFYGDTSKYMLNARYIEKIDESQNIYRLGLSVKFLESPVIYAKFNLLHNNSKIFRLNIESDGIYINGAQLTKTATLDEYIRTYGEPKSSLSFKKLYKKINNSWNIIENSKIYYFMDTPDNNVGQNNDIATLSPIINLKPFIKIGSGTELDKFERPIGYMYYNPDDEHYYIKTKKSLTKFIIGYDGEEPIYREIYSDCRLNYDNQKPNNKALVYAITLNQQTYQHYTRCCQFGKSPSHRYGFNTSGHGGFYGNVIRTGR